MALATGLTISAVVSGTALGSAWSARLGDIIDVAMCDDKEAGEKTAPTVVSTMGFSMEEARQRADAAQCEALRKSPREVLVELQRGNARFWMGTASRPEATAFDRRALISKQFPTVAVLSCADSRVPPELVFDQGLGSVFVVRVAGNVLATSTMASLQYAVHHLKVKVLVVLGHELCGAVKAAQLPTKLLEQEPKELSIALRGIKFALGHGKLEGVEDNRASDREAVTTNTKKQVETIAADEGIMGKVSSGELLVVGGFYEISSGIVDFFSEVSADSLKK